MYVWLLDDRRRQYDLALLASVVGGSGAELPAWAEVRAEFDAEIHAAPARAGVSDEDVILRALGL